MRIIHGSKGKGPRHGSGPFAKMMHRVGPNVLHKDNLTPPGSVFLSNQIHKHIKLATDTTAVSVAARRMCRTAGASVCHISERKLQLSPDCLAASQNCDATQGTCRILLLSPGSLCGADLLAGWRQQQISQSAHWPFQMVHCVLNDSMDGCTVQVGSTSVACCSLLRHSLERDTTEKVRSH